jgi:carboxymethylenebutenolidase
MSEISSPSAGVEFGAYIALPEKTPAPGIVVAQEIFGVNQVMRDICDWLAGEGFVAGCPDLFWRIEPEIQLTDKTEAEWARAFELFNIFDVDKGIEDMKLTLAHMRKHEACNGKAGTIGYCLGGKIAYLMATRSDADCNVGYYGVGLAELLARTDLCRPRRSSRFRPAWPAIPMSPCISTKARITLSPARAANTTTLQPPGSPMTAPWPF